MVEKNKCNPCVQSDNKCCGNDPDVEFSYNKTMCTDNTGVDAVQSSNTLSVFLSLGLSPLFPGLDCNTDKCAVDLRKPNTLKGYNLIVKGVNGCNATVDGYTISLPQLNQPSKPIRTQFTLPFKISLLDIHNKYLKPLVAAAYDITIEQLDTETLESFDPSCLLNAKWYDKKGITDFKKYQITKIYLNNNKKCIPKALFEAVQIEKNIATKAINNRSLIYPNPNVLNPNNGKWNTTIQNTKLGLKAIFETPISSWNDINADIALIKNKDNFNPNTATLRQKVLFDGYWNQGAKDIIQKWQDSIADLQQFYDSAFKNLFVDKKSETAQQINEFMIEGCMEKLLEAFKAARAADLGQPPPRDENIKRDLIRSFFIAKDLYGYGFDCESDRKITDQLNNLFECLDKEDILANGRPTGRFRFKNLSAEIIAEAGTTGEFSPESPLKNQECYKNLKINVEGSCDNGIIFNIVIGEDACDDDGSKANKKINYAVIKTPLEWTFTDTDNCADSILDNDITCTNYDSESALLTATGTTDDEFQGKTSVVKIVKENNRLYGYKIFRCKKCDDPEVVQAKKSIINHVLGGNGFCCSPGCVKEVNGVKRLKKRITSSTNSKIGLCCSVAQTEQSPDLVGCDMSSKFILDTFEGKEIIVDNNPGANQYLRSTLMSNCLPSVSCCLPKRDGGLCIYQKPKDGNRDLPYTISFNITYANLPKNHDATCESEPKELGNTRLKNDLWDFVRPYDLNQIKLGIIKPSLDDLLSSAGDKEQFWVVIPNCNPFNQIRHTMRSLKQKLGKNKELTDQAARDFISQLLLLKNLNRWIFKKNTIENSADMAKWNEFLAKPENLTINNNVLDTIINKLKTRDLPHMSILAFSTQNYRTPDQIKSWTSSNVNCSFSSSKSCLDLLEIQTKNHKHDNKINYCDVYNAEGDTRDKLLSYLLANNGTRFQDVIKGAINVFRNKEKIQFFPGSCKDVSVPGQVVVESKYGCINNEGTECCPESYVQKVVTGSYGSYVCLGGNKTFDFSYVTGPGPSGIIPIPHPVGPYNPETETYDDSRIDNLKNILALDMYNDLKAQSKKGDGGGVYDIKINVKELTGCETFELAATFKNTNDNTIIDSELKCKNYAQSVIACCFDGALNGGTCTNVGQIFDDYVYVPNVANKSQVMSELVTDEDKNINIIVNSVVTPIPDQEPELNKYIAFSINGANLNKLNALPDKLRVSLVASQTNASVPSSSIPVSYNNGKDIIYSPFTITKTKLIEYLTTKNGKNSFLYNKIKNVKFKDKSPTNYSILATSWSLRIGDKYKIKITKYDKDNCLQISPVLEDKTSGKYIPADFICVENNPNESIIGTSDYNGVVVTNCDSCEPPTVTDPPEPGDTPPTDPSDPQDPPNDECRELQQKLTEAGANFSAAGQKLKEKVLKYNEQVRAWNNPINKCSLKDPNKKCSNILASINKNYIGNDAKIIGLLNNPLITPPVGYQKVMLEPCPIKDIKVNAAIDEEKTKLTNLYNTYQTLSVQYKNKCQ